MKRERNGRRQRVTQRDHGTPETAARKAMAAAMCGAPGRPDATASGYDYLWRADKIDDGEWSAAHRYGKLYRLCSEAPGIRSGESGGPSTDLEEEQARLRKMQRSLTQHQRSIVTDVCGLMLFPAWVLSDTPQRATLIEALKVLDKG